MLEKSLATVENLSRKVGFNPWARTRTRCSLGPFPYVVVWGFFPPLSTPVVYRWWKSSERGTRWSSPFGCVLLRSYAPWHFAHLAWHLRLIAFSNTCPQELADTSVSKDAATKVGMQAFARGVTWFGKQVCGGVRVCLQEWPLCALLAALLVCMCLHAWTSVLVAVSTSFHTSPSPPPPPPSVMCAPNTGRPTGGPLG
jgi:hypothetical protein